MAKKQLTFIFENPNSPKETEELLKKILLEKLLSSGVIVPVNMCADRRGK